MKKIFLASLFVLLTGAVLAVLTIPVKSYKTSCFYPDFPTRLHMLRGDSIEKVKDEYEKQREDWQKSNPGLNMGVCVSVKTYNLYLL